MPAPAPTQRDAALHYARLGFEVFPANPRTKAPLTENGMKDATTDEDQIGEWWSKHPDALVACRIPADQVVLDIDPRHGGDTTWNELERSYAVIMSARVHTSGRGDGGAHHWFKRPAGRLSAKKLHDWARANGVGHDVGNGKWTSGIDILHHDHRYSILPPSPHPDTGKPYLWRSKDEPAEMPAFLAALVTADPPAPTPVAALPAVSDSIADWFNTRTTWRDLLEPAGWTLVAGDGETDGSKWKHPAASAASSASIRHDHLFVYTPNTHFPETEQGDPKGISKFRAFGTLIHRGDLSAAARDAYEMRDGPRPPAVALASLIAPPTGVTPDVGVNLPDEFWSARPSLEHIRQAAHSRTRSADAVLIATMARVVALIPPTVVLPPVVGSRASINFLAGIAATSGAGKSTAVDVARELVPIERTDVVADVPPGSGEGLIELFFEMVSEEGPDGKTRKVKRKTKNGALVYLDEGQALGEMGARKGATLLPTLRSAWSGQTLGQSNATQETHRVLRAHDYRMAIVVGFQLEYVADLIADAAGGTPQRFVFATATDPNIPDRKPAWPGPLPMIDVPPMVSTGTEISVDPDVWAEIEERDTLTARGAVTPDALDSHAYLVRFKVAAILGIIDGRIEVSAQDWQLAAMVMRTSNAVRTLAIEHSRSEQRRSDVAYAHRLAMRDEIVGDSAEQKALVSGAKSMGRAAHNAEGDVLRSVLTRAVSGRARKHASIDDMVDYAVANKWIEHVSGTTYRAGESRPV